MNPTQAEEGGTRARRPEPLVATGHYPTKGRQTAFESYVSNSLCARQTPETFGGVSTD